jgi:hypothetical protein
MPQGQNETDDILPHKRRKSIKKRVKARRKSAKLARKANRRK